MLAFLTGIQEFALDENKQEHEKLARAVSRVASHYNVPALDPVTRDWIMLGKTCAIIYGSRFIAYRSKKPAAAVQRAAPSATAKSTAPAQSGVSIPGFEHLSVSVNSDGTPKVRVMQ